MSAALASKNMNTERSDSNASDQEETVAEDANLMWLSKFQDQQSYLEDKIKQLEIKQDTYEQQFQYFVTDISESLVSTVCRRINEKPASLIPKVMEEMRELKDHTYQHQYKLFDLSKSIGDAKKME